MYTSPLEADTRLSIDTSLKNLGWNLTGANQNVFFERPRTEEEKRKLGGKRPDYVLYSKEDHKPLIVIEAKKKGEKIDLALEQGIHYAKTLGAPLVYATDGVFCKSYHTVGQTTPTINGDDVDEFIREVTALKFLANWEVNTVSPKVQYSRGELIKIFDEANNLLRGDGLRAGIERFGEFANILFLKLISESEDIKLEQGVESDFDRLCHWNYIKEQKPSARIEYINKLVYEKLNALYKTEIFTPLIMRNNEILKEIMDKLDPLILTDVDSDIKGDAFEYFLKESTSTKNDLGEYFTPRHIVKTMVRLTNPQIGEKVYDPFCGTGGFLIESFRHIHKNMSRTPATEKILKEDTIYGNEITNTARITKMNMILAGDGHSNIHMQDSLANPINGEYDVVIANMPYSQRTKYGNLYDLPSTNGDSICIQHCMKAINGLSENGRMALVVPEGFLFRKDLAKVREYILARCELQSIISLPQGVFLPYTGVKTNIIYATKVNRKLKSSEKRKNFWYFEVKSDGQSLDNHRRKLDTPSDLSKYEEYRKLDNEQAEEMMQVGFEVIPFDRVNANSFVLVGSRYRENNIKTVFEKVRFRDIAMITRGVTYQKKDQKACETNNMILPADNITLSGDLLINKPIYLNETITLSDEKRLKKDDIFICMSSGSKKHIAKVAYIKYDTKYYAGGFMGIIRINPARCIPKYLFYYLLNSTYFRREIEILTQGANINNISGTINDLTIPLPPLNIQKQIVDELDSYQQIIDAARVIVKNYKPKLPDLSEYPLIELGRKDLFEIQSGGTPSSKNTTYWNGDVNWITLKDLPPDDFVSQIKHTERKITQTGLQNSSAKLLPINSVVVSSRATIGRVGITKIELATNQGFKNIIIKNQDFISPYFLACSLKEKTNIMLEMASGATFKEISKTNFERIKINIPPLEIQNQILEQIESEQALIEPSKKLIEVFTKKINDRINQLFT